MWYFVVFFLQEKNSFCYLFSLLIYYCSQRFDFILISKCIKLKYTELNYGLRRWKYFVAQKYVWQCLIFKKKITVFINYFDKLYWQLVSNVIKWTYFFRLFLVKLQKKKNRKSILPPHQSAWVIESGKIHFRIVLWNILKIFHSVFNSITNLIHLKYWSFKIHLMQFTFFFLVTILKHLFSKFNYVLMLT